MDYARAKILIAKFAPDLILIDEVEGQRHLDVYRKGNRDKIHSIMLPNLPMPEAIPYQPATPVQPATQDRPAILAKPEVKARSSESLHTEAEERVFLEALKSAQDFI